MVFQTRTERLVTESKLERTMALDPSTALNQAVKSFTSFPVRKAGSLPDETEKPGLGEFVLGASTNSSNTSDQTKVPTTQSDHTTPSNSSPHNIDKNFISTTVSPPTSQQPSRKFLSRPHSSGGGVAAGFAFGRAKPATMNMSRQFGQASKIPTAQASTDEAAIDAETSMEKSPEKMIRTHSEVTSNLQPHCSPLTDKIAVTAQSPTHQAQSIGDSRHSSEPPLDATDANSPLTKITETLIDPYVSPSRHQLEANKLPVQTIGEENVLLDMSSSKELAKSSSPRQLRRPTTISNPSTPKEPRLPAQARSKVTKSRRKALPKASNNPRPPESRRTPSTPTQEELMNVLLLRYKHDKQLRDEERAAHATDVQDLKDISDVLWQQLQAERTRGQQLDQEILHYEAKMPAWGAKVKKLSDFVRGLTNDHHGLRDKAKEIQQTQNDLQNEKTLLNAELDNINQNLDATTDWTKNTVAEAKADLRLLFQQSENQQIQLRDNARLLDSERERNELYAAEIGKLTTSHNQLTQCIAVQDSMHANRLAALSAKLDDIQINDSSDSHEELKGMVQQCLGTVQGLRSTADVNGEDLQHLDMSVRDYTDK